MLFFFGLYAISFVIVAGCDTWFLVWLGLEINMISFIIIIYSRSLINIESCVKYFFVQSMGSGMFIGGFYLNFEFLGYVMAMVLSYKIGGGIFYYWFPSLCEGISWTSCFMLMTMQKILPLVLMSLFLSNLIWFMAFFSMMFGVVGAFNENKLKKLMAYSSIYHVGWIMVCLYLGFLVWFVYLLFYFFMMLGVVLILYKIKALEVGDVIKSDSFMTIILGILNMGGVPPMLGFFMKWWVFYLMMDYSILYMLIMVLLSVIMLYVYTRIVFCIFLGGKMEMVTVDMMGLKFKGSSKEELFLFGIIFGPILGLFFS